MTGYFYYDGNGVKQGPASASQLKLLAKLGTILPNTVIETQDGKRVRAEKVKGLSFGVVSPPITKVSKSPPRPQQTTPSTNFTPPTQNETNPFAQFGLQPLENQTTVFTSPTQNETNPFAQFGNQPFENQTMNFDFSGVNFESAGYTFPQSTPAPSAQTSAGYPAQTRNTYTTGRHSNPATIAFRQRVLIYTLCVMIVFGMLIRTVTKMDFGPALSFTLAGIYFAMILVWSPFVTFIIRKSLGGSTFVSILLCPVSVLPIGSWVYWWSLSWRASDQLRKAGYEVGFWGADMSQFGHGSHDSLPKYFIAGGISGVVAVWFFFSLASLFHHLQELEAQQKAEQQQVAQQQAENQPAAEHQHQKDFMPPVQPLRDVVPRPSIPRQSTININTSRGVRDRLRQQLQEVPADIGQSGNDEHSKNTRKKTLDHDLPWIKSAEEEYCKKTFIGACRCVAVQDLPTQDSPQTAIIPDKIVADIREEKKRLEQLYEKSGIDKKVNYVELSKEFDKTRWKDEVKSQLVMISLMSQRRQNPSGHLQLQPEVRVFGNNPPLSGRPRRQPGVPHPSVPHPNIPRHPSVPPPSFGGNPTPDRGVAETFANNLLNDDAKIISFIEQHIENVSINR
jgi:hypothetical protein